MKANTLEPIQSFLHEHHVLSLATSDGQELSACSLFYCFVDDENCFIVASSEDTKHIQHTKKNNTVAGNILLETTTVGKIQGVQFRGELSLLDEKSLENSYFKSFPYAKIMKPKLWKIKVSFFKMTDNKLGFGKKLIWP